MSHQDLFAVARCRAADLQRALVWLLGGVSWAGISFRGDCTWTPHLLASVALLWSWSDECSLSERFLSARRIALFLFPPQEEPASTYNAFMKILRHWTGPLLGCLQQALQQRIATDFPEHFRRFGFIAFGVDGSKMDLPRTRSHETTYSANRPDKTRSKRRTKKRSRKADVPQMWITTLWHMASGLPWTWRTGPADSSERRHLLEMLNDLPEESLIVGDAGFVGYDYAKAILDSGRDLLIRVGANVTLLKNLGYARENAGTVYLWPDRAARRGQLPLVLRLVIVQGERHPVYLVTSVLSKTRLSDRQVSQLYAGRWGVELFYRTLKQTFGRRKLRSTSAENALVELNWSMIALGALALYGLAEATRDGVLPGKLSMARVLRAFRRAMRDYRHPREEGACLRDELRKAVIDSYDRRTKSSRNYPKKKQKSPPGPPRILPAAAAQVHNAKTLQQNA